jgi:hypothetical protein
VVGGVPLEEGRSAGTKEQCGGGLLTCSAQLAGDSFVVVAFLPC